ncbi:MAG: DUF971 family protein [Verrucomicrobia bacterium]|jgi:DUF971 family protein|nr:MAG: DUF971 family protein [Verrucomicrobiota bacterium]
MICPEDIQCIGQEVAIRWQDGTEDYLPMEQLRALSPSAEQQGERDLLGKTIGGTSLRHYPGVLVTGWVPVGGYGIQFSFSDGHRTGIYSFAYLKEIARSPSA